jgi:hypothetical protein
MANHHPLVPGPPVVIGRTRSLLLPPPARAPPPIYSLIPSLLTAPPPIHRTISIHYYDVPFMLPQIGHLFHECTVGPLRTRQEDIWCDHPHAVNQGQQFPHQVFAPIDWHFFGNNTPSIWTQDVSQDYSRHDLKIFLGHVYDCFLKLILVARNPAVMNPPELFCTRKIPPHIQWVFNLLGAPFGLRFFIKGPYTQDGKSMIWASLRFASVPHPNMRNRVLEYVLGFCEFQDWCGFP